MVGRLTVRVGMGVGRSVQGEGGGRKSQVGGRIGHGRGCGWFDRSAGPVGGGGESVGQSVLHRGDLVGGPTRLSGEPVVRGGGEAGRWA